MTAQEVLGFLDQQGAKLRIVEERIDIEGRPGSLPDEVVAAIVEQRDELMLRIRGRDEHRAFTLMAMQCFRGAKIVAHEWRAE